jgi:hypothetical protein
MSALLSTPFSRHGHASGELRDAFLAAVHSLLRVEAGQPEPKVDLLGELRTVSDLCGLLWTCADALPRSERDLLADELGSDRPVPHTYAQAARALKRLLVSRSRHDAPAAMATCEAGTMFRDLREAMGMTQQQIADVTGYPQARISSMDAMTDMQLSTLDRLVRAVGGQLRLVVEFPDRGSVVLSGMGRPNKPNAQARYMARKRDRVRVAALRNA